MLVIAAQIAALDPLMVTCASTIIVFLLWFVMISIPWATRAWISALTRVCQSKAGVDRARDEHALSYKQWFARSGPTTG
jgi:hypothetical protein